MVQLMTAARRESAMESMKAVRDAVKSRIDADDGFLDLVETLAARLDRARNARMLTSRNEKLLQDLKQWLWQAVLTSVWPTFAHMWKLVKKQAQKQLCEFFACGL